MNRRRQRGPATGATGTTLVGDSGATDDDDEDEDEDEEEELSVAGRRRTTLPISTSCERTQHHTTPHEPDGETHGTATARRDNEGQQAGHVHR